MTRIVIAAAALNQTPLSWAKNRQHIERAVAEARASGARLVLCPELALSGYGAEDTFLWPSTVERAIESLLSLLPASRGLTLCVGLPLAVRGVLHNAVAVLVDGGLVGFAAKRHLARSGIHYEPRWFSPWPQGSLVEIEVGGRRVPVGDAVFDVGGVRIGFEICEDAWVGADRPGYELAGSGVDVVLSPSASHFAFGKAEVRRSLALSGAREFGAVYAYANLLGNEAGRAVYDGDTIIAVPGSPEPRIVAEGPRLSFADFSVSVADVELPEQGERGAGPSSAKASTVERPVVAAGFSWAASLPEATSVEGAAHPGSSAGAESASASRPPSFGKPSAITSKESDFARAVSLGLFDYARKSRSRGFVVSLSGGADSAAVLLLCRLALRLATTERGIDEVERAFGQPGDGDAPAGAREAALARRVLTSVYQATDNSSETTRSAARGLAEALGACHYEFDVEPLRSGVTELVEGALGRSLAWQTDGLALQNVQARVRAPSVWMLANVLGALLLATSNRSEAAVGYATMDGDTSGGLSPIAGIDKAYLLRWLAWMERTGVPELGPVPALAAITRQSPTAELCPPEMEQTDEKDLMPYPVLDAIERLVVHEGQGVHQVLLALERRFPERAPRELRADLRRFYRLFSQNQWKRERFAPSFHLDDANLDPRSWLRFPILSGGFEYEIAELARLDAG